jgi:dTDP-3-amino-3,4,6-trideoxy-alpha-D-glucose transaminase
LTVAFLDLSRSVAAIRSELDAAVAGVLDGGTFVLDANVRAFEEEFAAYCGAPHAVGVASGTDAIALALRALGVGDGDEVVTVANTCAPTVAGIVAAGARPVLVEPDPDGLTLDPDGLAEALTERTRAIVPVHLYGRCADMEPIVGFARDHGLVVVEDAAQAHGAEDAGRRAGTLGHAAAFSFYPTKNLGALGDGGAVLTADDALADEVRLMRTHGLDDRARSRVRSTNSRLDAMQAAVLRAKLTHLEDWTARRRQLADRYREGLGDTGLRLPADPPAGRHVFHLYVVRHPDRDRLRADLAEQGVQTLVHYPYAVHEHPAYADLAPGSRRLTTSERVVREVLSLPLYPELTDAEADRVVEAIRRTLQ